MLRDVIYAGDASVVTLIKLSPIIELHWFSVFFDSFHTRKFSLPFGLFTFHRFGRARASGFSFALDLLRNVIISAIINQMTPNLT